METGGGRTMAEMDRLLAMATKHLSDGNARIERQKKIIERLAAHGPAALKEQTLAHELLRAMYVSLKHMTDDKIHIERLHRRKTQLSQLTIFSPRLTGLLFREEQVWKISNRSNRLRYFPGAPNATFAF